MGSKKPERRDVTPHPKGGWDVKRPDGKRASSHHDTQKAAIDKGRQSLRKRGGGELRSKGTAGKVRA
jgi:hypothetical protein